MESEYKQTRITLDEPRSIYYAGQVLSGNIECDLTQPITYTVINVSIIGEANVHWTEYETEEYNGLQRTVNKEYKAKETYFNIIQCVAGGTGVVNLQPGNHKFPFQYRIPPNVPSSFKGEQGSVCYKIIVYFDRVPYSDPSMERDQLEKEFEVVAPFNLNGSEDTERPWDLEFEEMYSCCCSSSPMNIKIHLPASGYCPGQEIPIDIETNNGSNQEVKNITIKLIKKVCYHSKEPASDFIPPEEVLNVVKTGAFLSKTNRVVKYGLKVPDMITANLQNCSIIDVGFFIKVTINMSGCTENLEDEEEICIGLLPLASTLQDGVYEHPLARDLPQKIRFEDLPIWIQNLMTHPSDTAVTNYHNTYSNSPYPNRSSRSELPQFIQPQNVQNMTYPNSPYPNSVPYPNRSQAASPERIPLTSIHDNTNNIGFVVPHNLPQSGHQANVPPYPTIPNNSLHPSAPSAPPANS